ncbi:MAG: UvrD-helicase domain-containing protein, partial [Clostridia bacterium]|nr:UvrD-helicase domain-containing protein [Clostridia bacterium]
MSSSLKFTEEQEKVLKVFDKNAIISASAGSGKTSVLISKISNYIEEHNIDISNILALTYTNAAAGEMKDRLNSSLIDYIEKLETGDEKLENLIQQIDKISTADISTFHSFYQRIIKKYFYILEINPSFEILSNDDSLVLKEEAFKEAINNLKEKDFEKYLKITDILGKKRKDNAIRERIFKLENFLSSQLDKEVWLDKTAKFLYEDKDQTYTIIKNEIVQNIDYVLREFDRLLQKSVDFGEDKLSAYINDCCLRLNSLKKVDNKELFNQINGFCFATLRSNGIDNIELFEEVKETREKFSDFLKGYKNEFGESSIIEASFQTCKQNIQIIIDLYKNYIEILNKNKKDLNKYDFSDLEDFCFSLLQNEKVKEELKSQYKLIFVDEFQDTNPVQYEIIKRISNGNNVFIVGDPKQSIYAFRQTDVDIFNSVYGEYTSSTAEALSLKSNFRSNSNILNFVNSVFDTLMTKSLSGVDYKNQSRFEAKSANSCENNAVTISLIKKKGKKEIAEVNGIYSLFDDVSEQENISGEAELIAQQISGVIKEKIYDDKVKSNREVEYQDITILMRNRSSLLNELMRVFNKYNIPYFVNDKLDLLSSKDVSLLVSLLKLCRNFKDDISLIQVLASNFINLSYDELAEIRKANREEKYFYNACNDYLNKGDKISIKLNEFYKLIEEVKYNMNFRGIAFALNSIVLKNEVLQRLTLKEDGEIRSEIVQQFICYIEQSNFNFNLINLLDFIDNSKEIRVSSIIKSDSNAVNITTIHGSKGLEYPIVFLCDTGRDLNKIKPEVSDLKISKKLGIAIKNYDENERKIYPSIFEMAIKNESNKKDLAENLRLLYVALTRAKNKLFISGEIHEDFKISCIKNDLDLLNTKPQTFLNLILGSLDKEDINKLNNKVNVNKEYLINYIDEIQIKEIAQSKNAEIATRIEKLKEYLEEKYQYFHLNSLNLAQKTSVTQVALDTYGQENLTDEPEFFAVDEYLKGNTTAEKGTLIHSILEKVNFDLNGEGLYQNIRENIKSCDLFEEDYLFKLIVKNVENIKRFIPDGSKIYKEKQFLLNASINEVLGVESKEKILIQGKIDLICLGEKNIMMDYKYTSIKDENVLLNKYKNQLKAYQYAVEKCLS